MVMSDKIEIPFSKIKTIITLIGSGVFVVFGCFGAVNPEAFVSPLFRNPEIIRIIGITSGIFFGLCLVFITRKLFDIKSGLIIGQKGIVDNSNAIGLIEWHDITAIKTTKVVSTQILIVHLKNPEKYIERTKSLFLKKIMLANQKMYGSPISITANSLKIKFEDLETLIQNQFIKSRQI